VTSFMQKAKYTRATHTLHRKCNNTIIYIVPFIKISQISCIAFFYVSPRLKNETTEFSNMVTASLFVYRYCHQI